MFSDKLSIEEQIATLLTLGLSLEVSAYPKPGNVHRLNDFEDTKFEDFLLTSHVAQWYIYKAIVNGFNNIFKFGETIYNIVRDSLKLHGNGNTHLGTLILLTPIAYSIGYLISQGRDYRDIDVLFQTSTYLVRKFSTLEDSIYFYKAIRLLKPKYLRKGVEYFKEVPDVYSDSFENELKKLDLTFWKLLKLCSLYDIVCFQVITEYPHVKKALQVLSEKLKMYNWNFAIVKTYLTLLAQYYDTHVLRKNGIEWCKYVHNKVIEILKHNLLTSEGIELFIRFEEELRRNNVNPGATADILATAISLHCLLKGYKVIRV